MKKGLHSITLFEILIVVIVCVGFGVFLIRPMRIARQTAVAKPMTDLGARTATNSDRSIRRLDATRMPADEIRMDQIISFGDLRYLNLDHSEITDADLEPIAEHLDLRELHIVATEATDKAVEHIAKMKNLVLLDARATFLTDQGIAGLTGLKKLRFLRIAQTWITDAALQSIVKLPKLQFLDLRYSSITDAALPTIASMKSLTEVRLMGTHLHVSAVDELRARRPDLKIEFAVNDGYNFRSRVILRAKNYKKPPTDSTTGTQRKFRLCERKIGEELEAMGAQLQFHNGYIVRVICKARTFTDQHLRDLMWCRNLTNLQLTNPSVTSDGWSMIHRNRFIGQLTIRQTRLDPETTQHLSNLWHLYYFTTDGMTDEALTALNSRVQNLYLQNSPMTDASLAALTRKRLPRLNFMNCDYTDITDAAAESIEAKINGLQVYTPREMREQERQAKIQREIRQRRQQALREQQERDRKELERMVREAEAEAEAKKKKKERAGSHLKL